MALLTSLKLVAVQATRKSPAVLRRNKLTGKIDHQIAAAKAAANGEVYAAKRTKFVADGESGQRNPVVISTRVKQWWTTAPTGKINLVIRYGAKTIELAKGKNGIEVGSMDELIAAMQVIKEAVTTGELDAQIEQASGTLRAGFAKKK